MSVEHSGLCDLLQTFAELGAKYGKFDVNDVMLHLFSIDLYADLTRQERLECICITTTAAGTHSRSVSGVRSFVPAPVCPR